MKLKSLILSLLLLLPLCSYSEAQEMLNEEYECSHETNDVQEFDTQIAPTQKTTLEDIKLLAKDAIIDRAPLIAFFASAKAISMMNGNVKELFAKYPKTTAGLAAAIVFMWEIMPNGLNARTLIAFTGKEFSHNPKEQELNSKKAAIAILASRALVGAATYKVVKNSILK